MDRTVRSERFEPRMPFLPTAASFDKEFRLDEEVGPDDADLALDRTNEGEPRRFRPVRAVALWLGMAVIGVVLALVWRGIGAQMWPDNLGSLAFTAAGSGSIAKSPVEEQFGRFTRELDALKKSMDELRAAQERTAANMTLLQAAERQLQQRMSSLPGNHWYSDLAILSYPTAAEKKPAAATSPKQMPTPRVPSEAQDSSFSRRNDSAPLSLVPPRP